MIGYIQIANDMEEKMSEENKDTFEAALEMSRKIEADIAVNPKKYRVLTGDRPTGRLHIGHYFGDDDTHR